jgi:hypothetical protein
VRASPWQRCIDPRVPHGSPLELLADTRPRGVSQEQRAPALVTLIEVPKWSSSIALTSSRADLAQSTQAGYTPECITEDRHLRFSL